MQIVGSQYKYNWRSDFGGGYCAPESPKDIERRLKEKEEEIKESLKREKIYLEQDNMINRVLSEEIPGYKLPEEIYCNEFIIPDVSIAYLRGDPSLYWTVLDTRDSEYYIVFNDGTKINATSDNSTIIKKITFPVSRKDIRIEWWQDELKEKYLKGKYYEDIVSISGYQVEPVFVKNWTSRSYSERVKIQYLIKTHRHAYSGRKFLYGAYDFVSPELTHKHIID